MNLPKKNWEKLCKQIVLVYNCGQRNFIMTKLDYITVYCFINRFIKTIVKLIFHYIGQSLIVS